MTVSLLMYNNSNNPTNKLKNTGFENPITIYGASGSDWYAETSGAGSYKEGDNIPDSGVGVADISSATKFEGNNSLRLYTIGSVDPVQVSVSQDLILSTSQYVPNKYWNISCVVLGDYTQTTGKLFVKVTTYSKDEEEWIKIREATKELKPKSKETWNLHYFNFKVTEVGDTSQEVKLVFSFINQNSGSTPGEFFIDNVKVEESANPSRWYDGANYSKYSSFSQYPGIGPDGQEISVGSSGGFANRGGFDINIGKSNQQGGGGGSCIEEWKKQLEIEIKEQAKKKDEVVNKKPMTWERGKEKEEVQILREKLRECLEEETNARKKGHYKYLLDNLNAFRRQLEIRYQDQIDQAVWNSIDKLIKEEFSKRVVDRAEFETS